MDDKETRREERRAEREERHEERRQWQNRHTWMPGLILILIGVFFLARNYFGLSLTNWWALFILFPALGSFFRAYELYQSSHQIDRRVIGRAFGGLVLTMLAVAFLFGLEFGLLWPVFLILAGLGILLGGF